MKKKIQVGEQRSAVVVHPSHVVVSYELVFADDSKLNVGWETVVPNEVLEALHVQLCKATGSVPQPLTDDQRKAIGESLFPPLLVATFEENTPEEIEEGKRVDAFVAANGAIGRGLARNLSVEIPKDRIAYPSPDQDLPGSN